MNTDDGNGACCRQNEKQHFEKSCFFCFFFVFFLFFVVVVVVVVFLFVFFFPNILNFILDESAVYNHYLKALYPTTGILCLEQKFQYFKESNFLIYIRDVNKCQKQHIYIIFVLNLCLLVSKLLCGFHLYWIKSSWKPLFNIYQEL